MPLSSNTASFAHIGPVLDAALAAGGGRYRLATKSQAIRWRAEAYHYRKLLEKEARARLIIPGLPVRTPYDTMLLTIEGSTVVIGRQAPKGVLTDTEDQPLPLAKPRDPAVEEDELQLQADELARQLLGEE